MLSDQIYCYEDKQGQAKNLKSSNKVYIFNYFIYFILKMFTLRHRNWDY